MESGVGANCIYPIIGTREYGWSFIGTDIDRVSIESANQILELNPSLENSIELRLQQNSEEIFNGVIQDNEFIDVSICNPPFHASLTEARSASLRKLRNLKQDKVVKPELNFGGQGMELWCVGGELGFVRNMIVESKQFAKSCMWFSTLISKESNLRNVYKALEKVGAIQVKTIPMAQGNKKSRIVAWSFIGKKEHRKWIKKRWY
jgi:23S rRNA (adenine1618-N6)-methyltransferase